jgi:hypothetical protein
VLEIGSVVDVESRVIEKHSILILDQEHMERGRVNGSEIEDMCDHLLSRNKWSAA